MLTGYGPESCRYNILFEAIRLGKIQQFCELIGGPYHITKSIGIYETVPAHLFDYKSFPYMLYPEDPENLTIFDLVVGMAIQVPSRQNLIAMTCLFNSDRSSATPIANVSRPRFPSFHFIREEFTHDFLDRLSDRVSPYAGSSRFFLHFGRPAGHTEIALINRTPNDAEVEIHQCSSESLHSLAEARKLCPAVAPLNGANNVVLGNFHVSFLCKSYCFYAVYVDGILRSRGCLIPEGYGGRREKLPLAMVWDGQRISGLDPEGEEVKARSRLGGPPIAPGHKQY